MTGATRKPARAHRVPDGAAASALAAARIPGGPTPTSTAAAAPMDGAIGGAPGSGFYSPADGSQAESPAARSGLEAAAASPSAFNEAVLRDHQGEGEHGGTADRDVLEHLAAEENADPEGLAAEIARIRAFRRPLGAFSQKLALTQRPGYHRHWFNDVAGRIDEAKQNGWAHVQGRDKKPIARCVGSGRDKGALYAFAMEIPDVFWLEDQAAKHDAAQSRIDGLKGAGAFRAQPGAATKADQGKFYSPQEEPLAIQKGT